MTMTTQPCSMGLGSPARPAGLAKSLTGRGSGHHRRCGLVHPGPWLRWLDVGCGNGAFTAALMARCAPSEVAAVDPSEGQLAFARRRLSTGAVRFRPGDAQALP